MNFLCQKKIEPGDTTVVVNVSLYLKNTDSSDDEESVRYTYWYVYNFDVRKLTEPRWHWLGRPTTAREVLRALILVHQNPWLEMYLLLFG